MATNDKPDGYERQRDTVILRQRHCHVQLRGAAGMTRELVEVIINEDALFGQLAYKAAHNKNGSARAMHGAIRVRIVPGRSA